MVIGVATALIINIAKSGLSPLDILAFSESILNLLPKKREYNAYSNLVKSVNTQFDKLDEDASNMVTYKDSYYLGKMIGDVASLAVGAVWMATTLFSGLKR